MPRDSDMAELFTVRSSDVFSIHLLPYSTTVCGSAGNSPRLLERDAGTPKRRYHRRPYPSSLTKEGTLHRWGARVRWRARGVKERGGPGDASLRRLVACDRKSRGG